MCNGVLHTVLCGADLKGIGTKALFNGVFAFAWLNTKLCTRLQRHDLLMNRPAIKFLILKPAIQARVFRPSKICLEIHSLVSDLWGRACSGFILRLLDSVSGGRLFPSKEFEANSLCSSSHAIERNPITVTAASFWTSCNFP